MSLKLVTKIHRNLWQSCGRILCSTHAPAGDDSNIEYRSFQKSSTCQCIRLPLKKSRLANPFPDPLRIIDSDTVSDNEKASNMQSQSRLPEYPAEASVRQSRRFSTKSGSEGDGKCKKLANDEKCAKTKTRDCKPKFKRKACGKKQEAPYDSFSDIYRASLKTLKRNECNACPRKTVRISGKKPDKEYHTSATVLAKQTEHNSEADIQSIEAYVKTHNFPYTLPGCDFSTSCCSRGVTGYSRPFTYQEYHLVKKDSGDNNYKGRIDAFENHGIDEKCKEKKESTRECPKDLLVKKKKWGYKPKGDQ